MIVAEDASSNTKKVFMDKTKYYNTPLRFTGTKEELGHSIGKTTRAVMGVKDKRLAEILLEQIGNKDV